MVYKLLMACYTTQWLNAYLFSCFDLGKHLGKTLLSSSEIIVQSCYSR